MADRSNLLSVKKKNVEKKVEDKDKEKEKSLKKSKKPVNKTPQQEEKTVAGGQPDDAAANTAAAGEAAAGEAAEGANAEGNGDYQPIELPPFEIVSGSVTIVLCISITHTYRGNSLVSNFKCQGDNSVCFASQNTDWI